MGAADAMVVNRRQRKAVMLFNIAVVGAEEKEYFLCCYTMNSKKLKEESGRSTVRGCLHVRD